MKHTFRYTLSALAATLLAGCSSFGYLPYTFEQLRAADYTFPQNVHKIVVVLGTDGELCDTSYEAESSEYRTRRELFAQRIPSLTCAVIGDRLSKSEFMDVDIATRKMNPINVMDSCGQICQEHSADAILMVDKSIFSAYATKHRQGLKLTEALQTGLVFVTKDGRSMRLDTQNDTLVWISESAEDEFPDYNELYYSIAEQAGSHIVAQLVPSWEKRHRALYICNDDMRSEITDWDAAKNKWARTAQQSKGLSRICATINIGLYYERTDDVLESAMWFSKALDLIDKENKDGKLDKMRRDVGQLFNRSIDRQHEKAVLDIQMGNTQE